MKLYVTQREMLREKKLKKTQMNPGISPQYVQGTERQNAFQAKCAFGLPSGFHLGGEW